MADAVGLICWALQSPTVVGPLNLSAPDPRRQADFAHALGLALHRPSSFTTPAWLVRLALHAQAILPLDSRRVWPAKARAGGYVFAKPMLEGSLEQAV